jgi:hypothetical protein
MSTYGDRDNYRFGANNITYYPLVDSKTGIITLKSPTIQGNVGGTILDRTVGTIQPGTSKIDLALPNILDGPTAAARYAIERSYFSNPDNVKKVKNQAEIASKKAQQQLGVSPEASATRTNELLNNGKSNTPTGTGAPTSSPETGEAVAKTKTSGFGDFVYPTGLGKTKQDVIKFTMLEYKPSGLGATQTLGKSNRESLAGGIPEGRTIAGTVVLPIPNGISDTNSADWGQNSLNAVEAAAAAAAFTGITEGLGKGLESAGKSAQEALGDSTTKTGIAALFTAAAVGVSGGAILSRAEGAVINPNLELLFNGPQLRPFQFTFKLSARDENESKEIIKILNFFKRGMSPIKTESNLFLKAPNTFKIQYLHLGQNGQDHPYIGRIKECALQSVTISYTPEGQYATFTDGVMVSYQMQMQFQELEPVFNNDYADIEGIGY